MEKQGLITERAGKFELIPSQRGMVNGIKKRVIKEGVVEQPIAY